MAARHRLHTATRLLLLHSSHTHVPIAILVGTNEYIDKALAKSSKPAPETIVVDNHAMCARVSCHLDKLIDTFGVVLQCTQRDHKNDRSLHR